MRQKILLLATSAFLVMCSQSCSSSQALTLKPGEIEKLIIKRPPLVPPVNLHNSTLKGAIFLEVTLDPKGKVCELRVLSGHPLATTAAIQQIPNWKFKPYKVGGSSRLVRGILELRYDFSAPVK